MNQQSYLFVSTSFKQALDEFQQAVLSGDEWRIRMARSKVEEQAPLQAAEYDTEMRRGLARYYHQWQSGQATEAQFKKNFAAAVNAGIPEATSGSFEDAFPQLNFTTTLHGGLRYAVFNTERLWRVHQGLRGVKVEEKID